jgi:predicted enzyme related to lactoylglutathione lyase
VLKVKGIRSWNINADDLDDTVAFYRDLLGGDQGATRTVNGATVAHVKLGPLTVGVFDASEGPRPGVPHHTLDLEWPGDADAVTKELETRGIHVHGMRPHQNTGGYSLYVDDPAGNRLELSTDP